MIKNAIIRPNKVIASVKANPKIAYVNNNFSNSGLLPTAEINPANILPIPTPAP